MRISLSFTCDLCVDDGLLPKLRTYGSGDILPFDVVEAYVRLGHKYQFDSLCNAGLTRLRIAFPANLLEWQVAPRHERRVEALPGYSLLVVVSDHLSLPAKYPSPWTLTSSSAPKT